MEKYNKPTSLLCYACLSTDRRLFPLGIYTELFHKIHENSSHILSEICLCWECMTELKRIQLFIDKIEKAQKLLQFHYANAEKGPLKCLSNLKKVAIEAFDAQPIVESEQQDIKPSVAIKQEVDDYIYDDNVPETYLDSSVEQLKLEREENTLISIKRIKTELNFKETTRRLKYRKVTPKEFKNVVLKVHIGVSELESWLERERNSEFFRNLARKCVKCLRELRHEEELAAHNNSYHDKSLGPYSCGICQSCFASKHRLSGHVARHYLGWRCVVCGYQCYSRAHMRTHLRSHSDCFQCIECGACFRNARHFFGHYRALHRTYICDHCNKRHRSKQVLERHMTHHLPSHVCKICDQKFKSLHTLRQHNLYKHAVDSPELAFCVQCDRQFDNVLQFRRHVSSSAAHAAERSSAHEKKKKIPCPKCSNVYARKTNMMNHYRYVHMKESKYYCADCDKHFLNRTRYAEHRRFNHEGYVKEKNKLCNICGRGFAATRTLVNHIRTHTGERPFICTYCDSKFTQKHAMLSHVKFIHLKGKRKVPNQA